MIKSLLNISSVLLIIIPVIVWAALTLSRPDNIIVHDTHFRIGSIAIEPKNLAYLLVTVGAVLACIARTIKTKEKIGINKDKP